jgi:hypothetical protein
VSGTTTICAVLASAGYDALPMSALDAVSAIRANRFQLVILCTTLSMEQRQEIRDLIPGDTKVMALDGFIMPVTLLAATARLVGEGSSTI